MEVPGVVNYFQLLFRQDIVRGSDWNRKRISRNNIAVIGTVVDWKNFAQNDRQRPLIDHEMAVIRDRYSVGR